MTGESGVVSATRGAIYVRQSDVAQLIPLAQTTEQVAVEVLPERFADEVQRDRVHARVYVTQAETDDAECMPEIVVVVVRVGVEVEP